ncbi:MAG: hypothetical protein DDT22_00838 [candidate division WS2 bacterium]|nr:hypothetical protein [Bacillota bacterium]MBT9175164.1 hypothetical protein [Candidatus Lithacetigena glycinireducens]
MNMREMIVKKLSHLPINELLNTGMTAPCPSEKLKGKFIDIGSDLFRKIASYNEKFVTNSVNMQFPSFSPQR